MCKPIYRWSYGLELWISRWRPNGQWPSFVGDNYMEYDKGNRP